MIELYGFIFIIVLGTLFHFFYEWSNHNKIIGILCAVNESTWEHVKIALGPTFIWMLIEIPFIGNSPNFIFAKFISIITVITFIPLFFYAYKNIIKKDLLIIDILDFILAVFASQIFSYLILGLDPISHIITIISLIFIVIIFVLYLTLTLNAPNNFLFIDPVSKKVGIKGHLEPENYKHH